MIISEARYLKSHVTGWKKLPNKMGRLHPEISSYHSKVTFWSYGQVGYFSKNSDEILARSVKKIKSFKMIWILRIITQNYKLTQRLYQNESCFSSENYKGRRLKNSNFRAQDVSVIINFSFITNIKIDFFLSSHAIRKLPEPNSSVSSFFRHHFLSSIGAHAEKFIFYSNKNKVQLWIHFHQQWNIMGIFSIFIT